MAQGFTRKDSLAVTIKDSANLDAFSRLRVSNPLTVFSNQFTYDLSPLVFESLIGAAGTITYDATNRLAEITTNSFPGDVVYMQSYEHIPYQPGRSQLVFITFNMYPPGSAIIGSSTKFAGLGVYNSNGYFFTTDGAPTRTYVRIFSTTGNGNLSAVQTSWNIDKLDGTGKSGKTLNLTKPQILIIDFQALYVGRVRFGFDIDGKIIYVHEFLNANTTLNYPYIATANLPVSIGLIDLSSATDIVHFICTSVASEGGLEEAQRFSYNFSLDGSILTLPAALTYLTSIRPTLLFGPSGLTNRTKIIIDSIELLNTGNKPAYYQLGLGAVLNLPSYNAYNSTYSALEVDVTGTNITPSTLVFDSGYVSSGGGTRSVEVKDQIQSKYPITLDAAGAHRNLGTVFLYAYGVGGVTDLHYSIRWKEIR